MLKEYLYRGKHRVASRTTQRVAALTAATAIPMLATGAAHADPPKGWGPIIECESGGKNVQNKSGSSASGYFQIIDGTWKAHGGREFAKRAIDATFEEQKTVANRIYERRGSLADWNASKHCWSKKSAAVKVEQDEPKKTKGSSRTYSVREGDTLTSIAKVHDVSWQSLYEKNKSVVENVNRIYPGEKLEI